MPAVGDPEALSGASACRSAFLGTTGDVYISKNSPGVNMKSEELTELSQTLQREKIQIMTLRSHRLLQADSHVQCMCGNGNFIGLCPVPSQ